MKLKEIKDRMIVHCNTEDEAKELIIWAYKCGYRWSNKTPETETFWHNFDDNTSYGFYSDTKWIRLCIKSSTDLEFTDLIIQESEEELAEVKDIFSMISLICTKSKCKECPFRKENNTNGHEEMCIVGSNNIGWHIDEIIDICKQWSTIDSSYLYSAQEDLKKKIEPLHTEVFVKTKINCFGDTKGIYRSIDTDEIVMKLNEIINYINNENKESN